ASAFAQHVLGAPKIQHIRVRFVADGNAVLASMLSGDVDLAADVSLPLSFVPQLLQSWGPGHGTAVLHPNQWRAAYFQLRPDLVGNRALLDPRVRKALASAVDKDTINAAAWDGLAVPSDIWIAETSDVGRAVAAAITTYPFDLRASDQQMTDAGFTKGADGVYS